MLSFLPAPVVGALALLLHTLNTLAVCLPLFILALLKYLLPLKPLRRWLNFALNQTAMLWISLNNGIHHLTKNITWQVDGVEHLQMDDWYLVLANHQSWADIFALQYAFNRRIPFLKFFLKHELIYVPVLGLAWWALDFPFMRRHSKSYLKKHPEMKGKDAETTRKACAKFKHIPITVMVFVEGTRYTDAKHGAQKSPFIHLLKPKAGGVGMVLQAMGTQMHSILDVTIRYDVRHPSFWDFLSGRVRRVSVSVQRMEVPSELIGDYDNDPEFRARFQTWLNALWAEKDARLARPLSA